MMRRARQAVIAGVLAPLLLLAVLEAALRMGGYGYATKLFTLRTEDGAAVYVANPHVTRRYFPRAVARAPLPEFFAAHKPPGTLRVFVFGESAVVGECYQDVSFARMLRHMLQTALPGRTVEVINAGITAINSWAIMPFVRECVQYEPDLFVFYVGNNEAIGPYGPGVAGLTVGGRTIIATRQWVSSLKLYQLAQALGERLGAGQQAPGWRGMELFAGRTWHPFDKRVRRTWRQLVVNLTQMRATAQQHGVPVVMCTLAANIQDCAPFASLHDPAGPPARREACAQETRKGWQLFEGGAYTAARSTFLNARQADGWYADARYGYARACHALHETNAAVTAYWEASVADALQFRMPGYANLDIRAAFRDICADVEFACVAVSPMYVPGSSLLYDHVHFNLQGNYRAATTIFGAAAQRLHAPSGTVPPLDEVTRALGFTAFDERNALQQQRDFLRQPIFARQRGHAARMQRMQTAWDEAAAAVVSQGFDRLAHSYHTALAQRPADHGLWLRLGSLCREFGAFADGTAALQRAIAANPWDLSGYYELANALNERGEYAAALSVLQRADAVQPDTAETAKAIGSTLRQSGRHAEALQWLGRAARLEPGHPETACERGNVLIAAGDLHAAIAAYTDALSYHPGHIVALNNRGTAYGQLGMLAQAISNFNAAIALDPEHAEAYNNRGKVFAACEEYQRAQADFLRATALRPQYADAWSNLGATRALQGDEAGALDAYTRAIAADARCADAWYNRGLARATGGDLPGALADFDAVLALRPDDTAARAARDEIASAAQAVNNHAVSPSLKILTYNVLTSGSNEPERAAAVLEVIRHTAADILALQEVPPWMMSAWCAHPWFTSQYHLTSTQRKTAACGGQCIASRTPLTAVTAMPLPGPPGRFLLSAHTVVAGAPLRIAAVHLACNLDEGPVRAQQLDAVFNAVRDDPEVLLLGDFNFGDGEAEERHIPPGYADVWRALHPELPGYTWDIERSAKARANSFPGEPSRRLDRILIRSSRWQPAAARMVGNQPVRPDQPAWFPSDHFGLLGIVTLQPR